MTTFPFGIFKDGKPRRGRYSGATRDPVREMAFDEGDPDAPYDEHLSWIDDPARIEAYDTCWNERIWKDDLPPGLEPWAIAQSHMDIAWLWRMYQIVKKSRITHGKAAFHVLNIPEFKFTFSQPVMLEWLGKVHPETFNEVKRAVATGRFELQGGDYVECDGKIPSGESFCRQRLYGQRYYLDTFGKAATVGWLPDSFGYNNNIPQFLVKSGCKSFYTQKISGNWPPHAFPFAHFTWRSLDGSEVVVYSNNFVFRPLTRWHLFGCHRRLLAPGKVLSCDYTHPDPASAPELGETWPVVGIVFGAGDGGHGPTCEEVHRMRHYIRTGRVKGFLTASEYFQHYEAVRDRLPAWDGAELYYNLHRGTLTTQGLVKRMNRSFEWTLNGLQTILSLQAFASGVPHDRAIHETLTRLWKDTLLLQFHDILPGSSVPEVYDDCYDIWVDNARVIHELVDKHLCMGNTGNPGGLIVANQSARAGIALVEIPVPGDVMLPACPRAVDGTGVSWSCQHLDAECLDEPLLDRPRRLLACLPLEAWTTSALPLEAGGDNAGTGRVQVSVSDREIVMVSDRTRVVVSATTGAVTSILNTRGRGEVLSAPASIKLYRDWFTIERAWNIGPGYKECPFEDDEIAFRGARVVERGPVRWTVETTTEILESRSTITQRVQLYPDLDGVWFELVVDWHQEHAIMKHVFPLALSPGHVVAEGPYTTEIVTARPDRRSHLDAQRWECCWHTWLAVLDGEHAGGIAFMNDGKYGFDIDGSTLGITVLRGPDYPGATGYVVEERNGRRDGEPPTFTDQGKHLIRYAMLPFSGQWQRAGIVPVAHQLNAPPFARLAPRDAQGRMFPVPGITVEPGTLELASAKPLEVNQTGGLAVVLRVVETGRKPVTGTITFPASWHVTSVSHVDLVERELPHQFRDLARQDGCIVSCTLDWQPHEIHTILLRSNRAPGA